MSNSRTSVTSYNAQPYDEAMMALSASYKSLCEKFSLLAKNRHDLGARANTHQYIKADIENLIRTLINGKINDANALIIESLNSWIKDIMQIDLPGFIPRENGFYTPNFYPARMLFEFYFASVDTLLKYMIYYLNNEGLAHLEWSMIDKYKNGFQTAINIYFSETCTELEPPAIFNKFCTFNGLRENLKSNFEFSSNPGSSILFFDQHSRAKQKSLVPLIKIEEEEDKRNYSSPRMGSHA